MKPSRRFTAPIGALRLGACLLGAAAATGCAGGTVNPFATAPADPSSPIAADVTAAAETHKAYPSFSDIPKAAADQRPLKAWGQAAADVEASRDKLERETAPGAWSLGGTAAFADKASAAADRDGAADSNADTEAFAAAARRRATPPPPPR